jgi:hypothetical protein
VWATTVAISTTLLVIVFGIFARQIIKGATEGAVRG